MKWKKQILNLGAYQPGRSIDEVKKQYKLDKIVKLASNENPFGYSEAVKRIIEGANNTSLSLYPDGNATDLRQEMSKFLAIDPDQLIFANGTDEIIQIISKALLEPGKNTVMANPTFPQYKHNAVIEGAEVREVNLKNGAHDLKAMLKEIDDQTAIVWICNPNNPTGIYIPSKDLIEFLDKVPKDVLVVLDEAYNEYVDADDYPDALSFLANYPNIIITRTFSKIYGLASLRIGYAIASNEVIKALEPVRPPFNTNIIAQKAAISAINDQSFVSECRTVNRAELSRFYQFCQKHHLYYYPSQGNFILIDFDCDGDEVFNFLLTKGYIVRSGKALGAPTCVRITIGTKDQNNGLMTAIESYLNQSPHHN